MLSLRQLNLKRTPQGSISDVTGTTRLGCRGKTDGGKLMTGINSGGAPQKSTKCKPRR